MRPLVALFVLGAALVVLLAVPQDRAIFGLSHSAFASGAVSLTILVALLAGLPVRVRAEGAGRVMANFAGWVLIGLLLVTVYAFRAEFAAVAERVMAELSPETPRVGPGGEVTIRRRLGGEFLVRAQVNKRRVDFVFDTGASSVVLTAQDAASAGVGVNALDYDVPVTTANGVTTAAPTRIDSISVGPIVVRGVRALVARPGAMSESLLGMSFLERLRSYSVEGSRLILKGP